MPDGNGQQTETLDANQKVIQPWIEYWLSLVEQNTQWTQALMAGAPQNVDPQVIRHQWLDAMSKSIEAYMRTPTFLEGMKHHSETVTATKVTSELAKLEMARQAGIPHIEDISGLYDRLETANEVVLQRLRTIDDRLEAIEAKLDAQAKKSKKSGKDQ